MENTIKLPRWGFWLIWIGSALLADIIVYKGNITQAIYELLGYSFGIRAPVGNALRVTGQEAENLNYLISMIAIVVASIIFGLIMGAIQSVILKPYFGKSGWWWATAMGYGAANIIGILLFGKLDEGITIGIIPVALGLFQWFAIRKKIRKAYIWIVIVVLAWVLNYHVFYFILVNIGLLDFQAVVRDGLIIGSAMIWCLHKLYPYKDEDPILIAEPSS